MPQGVGVTKMIMLGTRVEDVMLLVTCMMKERTSSLVQVLLKDGGLLTGEDNGTCGPRDKLII